MLRSLICLTVCFGIGTIGFAAEPIKKPKSAKSKVYSTPVAPAAPTAYSPMPPVEGIPTATASPYSDSDSPPVTASPYGNSYSPPATPTSTDPTAVTPASKRSEPANSPPVDLKPVPFTGQKKWEAILAQPSELDFGERQTVTVKELLDQLRERHQLSLRLDIPTLSALLGKENVIGEPKGPTKTASSIAKRNTAIRVISGKPSKKATLIVISEPEESAKIDSNDEEPSEAAEDDVNDADSKPSEESADNQCDDECDDDDADHEDKVKSEDDDEKPQTNIVEEFLSLKVNIQTMCLKQSNVSTVLRQLLDSMPIVFGSDVMEMPFPISLTNACLLDYVVEDDGLLITTRMQALSHKETRVYSIKHLNNLNPEQLAKIVRQSIRPWSWRSQINDLGDQLRGSTKIPSEMVKSIVTTGVQLAAAQTGTIVTVSNDESSESPDPSDKTKKSEVEDLDALGNATVNGLVTLAHATVVSLEMIHHADFPTGTIFTLPGKLIVTQSQATHREIANLLKQLSDD